MLNESFDKIEPIYNPERKLPVYVFHDWQFDMNNKSYVVRINQAPEGKKVSRVQFGLPIGRKVRYKVTGITNIRKYIATVIAAIDESLRNPSTRFKTRRDGLLILVDETIYSKASRVIKFLLRRKFKQKYDLYHADYYLEKDELKGIFLVRKGKTFGKVFNNVDLTPEVDTEEDAEQDIISVAEIEPVNPGFVETDPEQAVTAEDDFKTAHSRRAEMFNRRFSGTDRQTSWYKTLFYTEFNYKRSFGAEGAPFYEELKPTGDEVAAALILNAANPPKIHEAELLAALNYSGILTTHVYDTLLQTDGSFQWGKNVGKNLVDLFGVEIIKPNWDKVLNAFSNSSWIRKVVEDKIGHELDKVLSRGYAKINAAPSGIYESIPDSVSDSMISTYIIENNLFEEEFFTIENGRRQKRYSLIDHSIKFVIEYIMNKKESISERLSFLDQLPPSIQSHIDGIFSNNYEIFELDFMRTWLVSGGTDAHATAFEASKNLLVNNQIEEFWTGVDKDNYTSEAVKQTLNEMRQQPRMKSHFEKMYTKTQEFYKNKLKKKYDGYKVKLYRGIGDNNVNKYVPAAIESWSSQMSTAKRFAKMMSDDGPGTIMYAEVPIEHIIGSYESLYDVFIPEEDLKGKKEFMVMGGTFATTPIYEYVPEEKTIVTDKPLSFAEWVELSEEEKTQKRKQLKIVKPSEVDSKTGKGIDPKEHLTRGYEDKTKKKS